MKKLICLFVMLIASTVLHPYVHAQGNSWKFLYSSTNLTGHSIAAECNPGGGTDCSCSDDDVSLVIHSDYGEVIANPNRRNTWVNAIEYKKFIEKFPDGSEIKPNTYKYTVLTRLPALPGPDVNQQQNPESVHLMMQFYDGRNKFGKGSKISLEATIFWKLNPWVQEGGEGRIYVYTTNLQLIDTGLRIPPDTDWHKFTFEADFLNERFTSLTVDGNKKYLNIPLPRLSRSDWGDEITFSITTESEPSWPKFDCQSIFYWNQYFKNVDFLVYEGTCNPDGTGSDGLCHVECNASVNCDGALPDQANTCCSGCYYTDITGDRKVDILDIAFVAKAFLSTPGYPRWNEKVDLNKDEKVDIIDISMVARKYATACIKTTTMSTYHLSVNSNNFLLIITALVIVMAIIFFGFKFFAKKVN